MKKLLISIFILSISLVGLGCGKDDSIELTKDNYEEYLDITARCHTTGSNTFSNRSDLYDEIESSVIVQGVSSNFNYKDVTVTVLIAGSYKPTDSDGRIRDDLPELGTIKQELNIKCDVSGSGEATAVDELNEGFSVWFTTDQYINAGYEVVNVTGKVVPAN